MQIAIADTTGNVSIWCEVIGINKDGSINFSVINGAWDGKYHNNTVYVEYTKATYPGFLVWVGRAKFNEQDYNDAIPWIQDQIDDPEYVMTQPNQYVEPVRQQRKNEPDDIPF